MVIVDTSAWIEYLTGGLPAVVAVGIADLVYCEVMQGIYVARERARVSSLLLSLPQFEIGGFAIAGKSAANYRLLRSKGVTVRKTIDVLIGTFCAENDFQIVHSDSDFDLMAPYIDLDVV